MRYRKEALLLVILLSVGCEDATAPRKLRVPVHAHFMEVAVDPNCNYVSTECAYTINGVTVYGGGTNNPPPLIVWVSYVDPPSSYDWLSYPDDGNYAGYYGATILTNSDWLGPDGTIVESGCDPRPFKDPHCLMPLEPKDSVFLTKVLADLTDCDRFFKCPYQDYTDQEMIDQCTQMMSWLRDAIVNQTFNRPAGVTNEGFFRGHNGVGSIDQTESVHGGSTWNGSAHLDEREWESIYAADSVSEMRRIAQELMHEAVHMHGPNHDPPPNPNYAGHDYFKYLIPGNRNGCVRVGPF